MMEMSSNIPAMERGPGFRPKIGKQQLSCLLMRTVEGLAVLGSSLGDSVNIHQWTVYNLDNQRFPLIAKRAICQFEIDQRCQEKM